MAMWRTDVIVFHFTIFKTSCSRIHGISPSSFSRDRIGLLVNSVYSLKCMSVSKPLALISPFIFLFSSPTTSQKKTVKNRVDIFLCKFWRYLNNNSAYRNTRVSADDWKRLENRKATTVQVGWSRVNSIKFEGHVTLWRFLVALCNKRVPYSGHWLCFGILYGSEAKQLLYLCTVLNDSFFKQRLSVHIARSEVDI